MPSKDVQHHEASIVQPVGLRPACAVCTGILAGARSPYIGDDGQGYLDGASRISADMAGLRALWHAEERAEIARCTSMGEPWLVPLVLGQWRPPPIRSGPALEYCEELGD